MKLLKLTLILIIFFGIPQRRRKHTALLPARLLVCIAAWGGPINTPVKVIMSSKAPVAGSIDGKITLYQVQLKKT